MVNSKVSLLLRGHVHVFIKFPRKAEWLGNDNRKTMIKVKTIGQILPFKNGTALPSPSPAPGWALQTNLSHKSL